MTHRHATASVYLLMDIQFSIYSTMPSFVDLMLGLSVHPSACLSVCLSICLPVVQQLFGAVIAGVWEEHFFFVAQHK